MCKIEFRNVTFAYPKCQTNALDNISLNIRSSEFAVICGKSGCGKSTLLRHIKKSLMPYGDRTGEVLFDGRDIESLSDREGVARIGFVQQDPDNQIVTDKVWHELAFGLESLGLDNASIKRRVAETASFFEIQTWFRRDISGLSGGQKQLLNLAAVMVMQPEVLILDEPTSQLDPIAASEFLGIIHRINRELGTTVIVSEHRLEEVFPMADTVVVMDEGRVIFHDAPRQVGQGLIAMGHDMFYGLPAPMRIFSQVDSHSQGSTFFREDSRPQAGPYSQGSPLTIREGRLWLETLVENSGSKPQVAHVWGGNASCADDGQPGGEAVSDKRVTPDEEIVFCEEAEKVVSLRDVWFRYNKKSDDILRGLNIDIKRGECFCLLGGNGVGKSTTLKAVCRMIDVQRGAVTVCGANVKDAKPAELFSGGLAMLPQNPRALFTEITVEEELLEALYYSDLDDEGKVKRIEDMVGLMCLDGLRASHPYDLSGGEQQRLALGKILITEPKVLLLDEPTKSLDPFFKRTLADIFRKLKAQGVTIFMVSHDIEFCAEYGDRCAMFFDGEIVSAGEAHEFFAGNSFYTTAANRIARRWMPGAVTCGEVAQWLNSLM